MISAQKLRQVEDSYLNEVLAEWLLNETGRPRMRNQWSKASERRRAKHRERATRLRKWLSEHEVELAWRGAQ